MRGWFALVLILLPAASAYGGEDPAGDVQYRTTVPGSDPTYTDPPRDEPDADVLRVEAVETSKDLFVLEMERRGGGSATFAPEKAIYFTFGAVAYRVKDTGCAFESNQMSLQVLNTGSQSYEQVGCVDAESDGRTWRVQVPKDLVRDEAGLPVGFGTAITGMWAQAWAMVTPSVSGSGGTEAVDRAPDEGTYAGALTFELGEGGFGDFLFATPSPLRASNGGPDTMVFAVTLENRGTADAVLLTTSDVPTGWEVRHPARMAFDAGERVTFPVIVSTQSAHAHGSTERFLLEAETTNGETGSLDLGIHYLDIPQLAGHHPDLYIHTAPSDIDVISTPDREFRMAWFNTVSEQDGADDAPMQAPNGPYDGPEVTRTWRIPLDPALLIGMDFEVRDVGDLTLGFVSDDSVGEMSVSTRLMHCHASDPSGEAGGAYGCPEGSWFELARSDEAVTDVMPDRSFTVDSALHIDGYADLVPYVDGSNIALWISATMTSPPFVETFPSLDPRTSFMRLPLNEYKDPLDAEFEDLGALAITARSAFEKDANPGQTVWFAFDVENRGAIDRELQLSAIGHGQAWTRPAPEGPFRLEAGENRSVAFAVEVPEDVPAGAFAELFAIVEDAADPSVAALSQFRVAVVDHPVEPERPPDVSQGGGKESPAPTAWYLLAMSLWLVRRRRRPTVCMP